MSISTTRLLSFAYSALQHELSAPNFRDIDSRFRRQLIELETTKMATTDLDKFHKVRRSGYPIPYTYGHPNN